MFFVGKITGIGGYYVKWNELHKERSVSWKPKTKDNVITKTWQDDDLNTEGAS